MDDAKHQLVDRLKSANNILVTVSRNPSVDQLAACLGLALLLNKQGKHVAAVFSGEVPSTLEFLKPEETLEKNTDSLRDFIIALDKSKADKLRYKVEDNVVRIFITPYRTSISQADLEFSQGDFNVDLVVALGVSRQEDLDEAITAHGRILHDATVASVNISGQGELGSINWQDPQASSLSELATELAQDLGQDLLDGQIATALLTGIVSATNRFSNDKTTSQTMSASAALMSAGANQQLVASKLEQPEQPSAVTGSGKEPGQPEQDANETPDGTIEIEHSNPPEEADDGHKSLELPAPNDTPVNDTSSPPINPDQASTGSLASIGPSKGNGPSLTAGSKLISQPPVLGGTLTANTRIEGLEPTSDPLSLPATEPSQLLERKPGDQIAPPSFDWTPPAPTGWNPPPADPVADTKPAPEPEPDPKPPAAPPEPPEPDPPAAPPPPEPPSTLDAPSEPAAAPALPEPPADKPSDDKPTDEEKAKSAPLLDHSADMSLSELEEKVKQSEDESADSSLDAVRNEINKALSSAPSSSPPAPIEALNAQPLGDDLHPVGPDLVEPTPSDDAVKPAPGEPADTATAKISDPTAPPPVPPPIPFQFGNPS